MRWAFVPHGPACSASFLEEFFSETPSSPPVTSSASMDEGISDRARPGYRLCRLGGGSYGRVGPALAPLSQALVKRQVRFLIPNAHERTKASFSSIVRFRVSATRIKKSTGI